MSSKPSFPIQRKTPTAQWLLALGLLLVSATATAQARQAPRVTVMTVGAQAVGAGLEMDGCLQAVRQTVLSALASGRIAQLSVKAGDQVKAGQVLAVIDDRATQAGVAQA
jgi:multidrug efflux pump subunit AcrA (membrane-fusion protein)